MIKLYDLARCFTSTTGTGSFLTVGSPVSGFLGFTAAGVQDGETVRYAIRDGTSSEVGNGVWTAATNRLTRNVLKSTASDTNINLSGSAQVMITPAAEDFAAAIGSWNYWKIRARSADPDSAPFVANLQLRPTIGGSGATVADSTASSGTSANAYTGTGWQPSNHATFNGSFGSFTLGDDQQYVVSHFTTAQSVAEIAFNSVANARTSCAQFDVLVSSDNATWYLFASFDCNITTAATQTFKIPTTSLGGLGGAAGGATALNTLTDVNVTEGSSIDGQALVYQNSSGKFIANSIVGEALWTPPTTATFPTTKLGTGGSISNMSGGRGVRLTATKAITNVNSTTYAMIAVPTGGAHSGWIATVRLRRHWGLALWAMTGMIIRDSGSGKSKRLSMGNDNIVGFNFNTYSADDTWFTVGRGAAYNAMNWWQRIWHDGTSINWQISQDGETWETILTESPTAYLTSAPTHVGIAMVPNLGGDPQGANPMSMDCLSWSAVAY